MQFTDNINSSRWSLAANQIPVNNGAQFCKIGTIWTAVEMRQKLHCNKDNN